MGSPSKAQRNAEIVAAVEAGEPCRAVAARFGITYQRVSQIAGENGGIQGGLRTRKMRAAVALWQDGDAPGFATAARKAGVSPDGLRRYLAGKRLYRPRQHYCQPWSDEEVRLLWERYNPRDWGAVRALAADLGRTRNQVIGKAQRLGLGMRKDGGFRAQS